MKATIDLPDDLFDADFSAESFAARIRELAVIDLVRSRRIHEHEAIRMLGIERWELIERMKAAGVRPTEALFDEIRGDLNDAIAARGPAANRDTGKYKEARDTAMRLLHTMIRVNNLDDTIKFYCDSLGMKLLRRQDYPTGRFTLAFVGYGDESSNSVIELTHNWDTSSYEIGSAFGHLAVSVDDLQKYCEGLRSKRVKITREPGPMKFGGPSIAFIEDPNGYKIELIERAPAN